MKDGVMRRFLCVLLVLVASSAVAADRPNILLIVSEDNGPELGCYGDEYADTPNIDALAAEGLRYEFCWSNAPVCAPARTTMISGMYPPSTGAEHMRSLVPLPAGMKFYPQHLREAGYFTTNVRKEDFNLAQPGQLWDVKNDANRPWAKRKEGQPFFSMINIPTTHESRIRDRPHTLVHDPAGAPIPAYHPDTPEVRHDWAQYYDNLTVMDAEVGAILARLDADGLTDETIVFYCGDHGSGMPRSKRWPFDSGLHVPLVVRIPEKFKPLRPADYKPGAATGRLVSFVDFAPTFLSLAGIKAPANFQGSAFLGEHAGEPNDLLVGFRGRMDERIDCIRSVTDGRYVYVRNYMPHRIYGQHIGYMFQTPTTQVWKRMFDEGRLDAAQEAFWQPKPSEELYDLTADPDEVNNLVDSPEHQAVLQRLRTAQRAHAMSIRDVGLLPEAMLHSLCRQHNTTPYELGHNDELYPLARVLETADMASRRDVAQTLPLVERLDDANDAVRYWAATGLLVRGDVAYPLGVDKVRSLLVNEATDPSVRVVTAELAGRYDSLRAANKAVEVLIGLANYENTDEYVPTHALLVLDELLTARPEIVERHADAIKALPLPDNSDQANRRARDYPGRLKATIEQRLSE